MSVGSRGVRQQMDLIRASAKSCSGISQQAVLLAAAEGICLAMAVRWMVCPSSRSKLSADRQDEFSSGVSIYGPFRRASARQGLARRTFICRPRCLTSRRTGSNGAITAGRRSYRHMVFDQARTNFSARFIDGKR